MGRGRRPYNPPEPSQFAVQRGVVAPRAHQEELESTSLGGATGPIDQTFTPRGRHRVTQGHQNPTQHINIMPGQTWEGTAAGGRNRPTNPGFGEVGWMSARPLADPNWSQWYDKYLAGGGGNPVSHSAFRELAQAGPNYSMSIGGQPVDANMYTSNQLRGEAVQHPDAFQPLEGSAMQQDPYYNVQGLGPGYNPSQSPREEIMNTSSRALRGLRQAVSLRPNMAIKRGY
jgi:hypothetical protein